MSLSPTALLQMKAVGPIVHFFITFVAFFKTTYFHVLIQIYLFDV